MPESGADTPTARALGSELKAASAPPRASLLSIRSFIPAALVLLALVIWLAHGHIGFNWASLHRQLRFASVPLVLLAIALTYIGYWIRAWRWSVLLGPIRKSTALELLSSQLIGFTIAGLFGRFADLGRPYLIARRLHTKVATQLAVYSIERAFDLAAAAIIFSTTLAFAPRNMPHHEAFARAGAISLAATLLLAIFALALRFAGARMAALAGRLLKPLSQKFAASVAERILEFSHGLRIVSTPRDFIAALVLSLIMWLDIAMVYVESTHAFRASPQLAGLSFAAAMLLLASGMGGSLLQLPVLGWFTQIAVFAAALHGFFNVPLETASACGAVLLVTTNLCVIPAGLIAARIEGITLRDAAHTQKNKE